MEEVEVIREYATKISNKYKKILEENNKLKEKIKPIELLEKETKQLKKLLNKKNKEVDILKTRLEKKMKYSKKYKWDAECLYVKICRKKNIKQCDKCKETGEYIGGKYGREVKGIQ